MLTQTERPPLVLYVEDDPAHAELTMASFEDVSARHEIRHVADGEQALIHLKNSLEFDKSEAYPRPNLVLLDLRLPLVDGQEVLKEIKSDESLATIPVIILTTSSMESDVAQAYRHRANSYLVKPLDYERLSALIETLCEYWLDWNKLPDV